MKRPTQIDVARLAGVSRATVSYVINGLADSTIPISEDTRRRVLQAVEELGYQPDAVAQSLRYGSTSTIGLLIPDTVNPHYWQIVAGVEEVAQAQGYNLLFTSTSLDPERERQSVRALARRRIDGLILLLSYYDKDVLGEINTLVERRRPLVLVNEMIEGVDVIHTGHAQGARDLMAHVLGLGHRRIGLIHGVAHRGLGAERMAAYCEGLQQAGIALDERLISYCGTTLQAGYDAACQLLAQPPRPTALVVINDLLAVGALRAVIDQGLRVPQDVSIASFDNVDLAAYMNPSLTTVDIQAVEIGRAAARLIFQRLGSPTLPPQQVRVPGQLMVRGSTGPRLVELLSDQ
jgi:LacI family transcriptional regulator